MIHEPVFPLPSVDRSAVKPILAQSAWRFIMAKAPPPRSSPPPPAPLPPPTEISSADDPLLKIREGAQLVREKGDALTNRIQMFEHWLNKLPGKVSTGVTIESDESGEEVILSLEKRDSLWLLEVYDYNAQHDIRSSPRLLRDATLSEKVVAVAKFPSLLKRLAEQQRFIAARAAEATTEFDGFAKSIGLMGGS